MKCITYVESIIQLEAIINSDSISKDNHELIVGSTLFSRYSKTSLDEMLSIVSMANKNNLAVVLEWDSLNQEERFQKICLEIDRLPLHEFKAIRLQDPGAVEYIKNKYPWLKIQIILENGNHNLLGLNRWVEYLGEQCERLILSNELSREMLREYSLVITKPLEVLIFGRILLFYSPRKLLSPLEKQEAENQIEAFGTSEESPHSGFPLIENIHGTFMFNVKDLYLLDHLQELNEMGIQHLRVDLRFDDTFSLHAGNVFKLFKGEMTESELNIKKNHPRPLIKGFYNINKTDVLFTKLKNKRTQRQDRNYLGEIVDVERDVQLALMIKVDGIDRSKIGEIKLVTPEGKEKIVQLPWMRSSLGHDVQNALKNDLVLIPYTNGVTVKTQVYLNPKT